MKIVLNKILFAALGVMALTSCMKDKVPGAGDAGQTIVKLLDAGEKVLAFDAKSTPQSALLIDVRRDANSNGSLNTATNVSISLDQDFLDTYNDENDTEYEFLPTSMFTTDPAFGATGLSLTFAPGEFAKPINFTLKDATKMDFSKQYALPLTITSVDAGGKISSSKTAMVIVLVKNQWDGAYEVTGTMEDLTSSALTGFLPNPNYHLVTSGAATVSGFDAHPDWMGPYLRILNNGADSYYGSFSPVFELDPATNKVVKVTNIYGQPAGNTRSAGLDPSGENYYDPATKVMKVKFFMYQPSAVATAPHIRVKFDWTLKRTGNR